MSTDDTSGRYDLSQTWTNADEVLHFLGQHPRGTRYKVGDHFTLPDIEQTYAVHAVRPFVSGKTSTLYLDLKASCAVEGCGKDFLTSKTVTEMRKSMHLTRTCEDHRRQFKSPDPKGWKTSAELAARAEKKAEACAKKVREAAPRTGPNEQAVLDAMGALSLVRDTAPVRAVVDAAVAAMERPAKGVRDTRRQRAVRALESLRRDRRVRVVAEVVVL